MAAHWDITDAFLSRQLNALKSEIAGDTDWQVCLYQNDYTPIPGSDVTDYVPCDFFGYDAQQFTPSDFGSVTVVDHVAMMTANHPVEFIAADSGFSTQNVYGYYMLDSDGEYIYGERFATMRVMHPEDILKVTPIYRDATYPNP